MSGTPTISSADATYTVIGGGRPDRIRKYTSRLTILVMNRGDRLFMRDLFKHLEALSLGEILWIGARDLSRDVEDVSRDFPDIRFILVRNDVGAGEMINIGMRESGSPLLLAMWSDMRIISAQRDLAGVMEKRDAVCILPILKNRGAEILPSFQSPSWRKGRLTVRFHAPTRDGEASLFPFDYCSVYQKQKFMQLGGFDQRIANPYWQKMDFGFRCHLWGERIEGTTAVSLEYSRPIQADDSTPDESYKAFFLKNIAVRVRSEAGAIPWWKVFEYIIRSGGWPAASVKEFKQIRGWVELNRSRFRKGHREVVDAWGAR